jgi:hypothetical protein
MSDSDLTFLNSSYIPLTEQCAEYSYTDHRKQKQILTIIDKLYRNATLSD